MLKQQNNDPKALPLDCANFTIRHRNWLTAQLSVCFECLNGAIVRYYFPTTNGRNNSWLQRCCLLLLAKVLLDGGKLREIFSATCHQRSCECPPLVLLSRGTVALYFVGNKSLLEGKKNPQMSKLIDARIQEWSTIATVHRSKKKKNKREHYLDGSSSNVIFNKNISSLSNKLFPSHPYTDYRLLSSKVWECKKTKGNFIRV